MRRQFYSDLDHTRRTVNADATWAAVIRKVDGGWTAWESVADYATWRQQR